MWLSSRPLMCFLRAVYERRIATACARAKRRRPWPTTLWENRPASAEHVLRHAGLGEDVVARSLELRAQRVQVNIEQPALPFAHLAADDHGLDVAAIHHLNDRARHMVDREDV